MKATFQSISVFLSGLFFLTLITACNQTATEKRSDADEKMPVTVSE